MTLFLGISAHNIFTLDSSSRKVISSKKYCFLRRMKLSWRKPYESPLFLIGPGFFVLVKEISFFFSHLLAH